VVEKDLASVEVRPVPGDRSFTNQLHMIRGLVDSAADILLDPRSPLRELGELMHQSWQLKRDLSDSVSNLHPMPQLAAFN
jgi:galactokinase/mevalonate kinase-like predicted kinase